MTIAGERRLPDSPAAVEAVLLDLPGLAARLPAVESVEEIGGGAVRAVVRPQTSLGATSFAIEASVERPSGDGQLRFQLAGRRAENAMHMTVELQIEPDGDGSTVCWRATADFYGVLAAVGQRALPALAADQLDALFAAVGPR